MKHVFALLLALGVLRGQAQRRPAPPPADAPRQLVRTELLLDPATDEVQVQALPADTSVVLLIRQQAPGQRRPRYVFQRYGPVLQLRHEQALEVPDECSEGRLCSEPGAVYAVFTAPSKPGHVWVAAYNVRTGHVHTQEFSTKLVRSLGALKALNGRVMAVVALSDQQHLSVLLLEVATGKFRFLPTVYEPLSAFLTSATNPAANQVEFVVGQTNGRKKRLLLRRLAAEQGELLHTELVQTASERNLLAAQLSPPADTAARLLVGTYGLRDGQYAQGLFAADLARPTAGAPALRFYDFRRLRHSLDHLRPAHEARLRDRSARREARAEGPIRWRYHVLLHELLPQPDGSYTLVAEVYTPQYNYTSSPYGNYAMLPGGSLSPLGMPLGGPVGGRALLGYRTSHVLLCGFDQRGNLLWDNAYVLPPDVLRPELEEAVQPLPLADGRLVVAYLNDDNELHYKCISRSEAAPNDQFVTLLPLSADSARPDKVLETEQPAVLPWVPNQFVASGFQRIEGGANHAERHVFFLQAVQF